MPDDPSWHQHFDEIPRYEEKPTWTGVQLNGVKRPEGFDEWAATNIYEQRQPGYVVATVTCPLGDLSSDQMRALADISTRYAGGNVRITVEQNLVMRWVSHDKVVDLYKELKVLGLAQPGAGSDCGCHRVPRHRHLQAGHRIVARISRRIARATRRLAAPACNLAIRGTCESKFPVASTVAASITSPISVSTGTAETSVTTPSPISR